MSTALHETGHFFLEVMGDLVESGDATDQIKKDYATILQWFGVSLRSEIKVEHHEKLARGFEAYLMEGKAPTAELRSAFAAFRAWLSAIYKSIKNLNVELNDDVRKVFDRILATDEQLEQAQKDLELFPLFADPKSVGMTEEQAARYAKAIEEAKRVSRERLDMKLLAAANKERGEMWKNEKALLVEEIEKEINKNPIHVVRSILQTGKMPDGTDAPQKMKLDKQALLDEYGKDYLKKLPRPYMYAEDGVNHNAVAEMFGFSSGDEMLTQIINTPKTKDYVNAKADAILRDKYGDPMFDELKMTEEAYNAILTDQASNIMRQEFEYLAKNKPSELKGMIRRVATMLPSNDVIREQAETEIAKKRVRDLQPGIYNRAVAKYGKEAAELFTKGDFEGALEAKRRQIYNYDLAKAANLAKSNINKQVDYLKGYTKVDARKRLGKAGKEYLDQVDSILERFEFVKGVSLSAIDKRASLLQFVKSQEEMGTVPQIPEKLLTEAYKQNYKNMTVDELKGVHDAVKNIAALARLKNKLLKNDRIRSLNEAVDLAVSTIEANSKGKKKAQIETRRPEDELYRLGAGFFANHRKLASYIREMDGFRDNGELWNMVVRPINEAADEEAVMIEKATITLKEIFDTYKDKKELSKKVFIPEIETSLTKEAILSAALNTGTEDNYQKLLDGYKWDDKKLQAVLSSLTEQDWKFVQGIWDHVDTYWNEIKSMSERVDGLAPEKVKAKVVKTQFGEFPGGYYPLKYDDRQEPRAYANLAQEAAKQAMQGASVRSTTKHGHRKERVKGVEMPIRLDFGVVFEHINAVAHDLSHYEMLIDTNRILGNKKIQQAIIQHYGDIVYGELRDALNDIAAGNIPAQKTSERVLNRLRSGVSIASMGWNLMTTVQQPLGIIPAMAKVGPKWVGRGIAKWLGDAKRMESTVRLVHEKSSFMKLRHKTQSREIAEIRNSLTDPQLKTDLYESFFYFVSKGQMIADIPTWIGAYEKAMAEQVDKSLTADEQEKQAIALSDQAVIDTQGSGHIKDLANIQRGSPIFKLWTSFYSYFSVIYNLNVEAVGRTNFNKPASVGRLGVDMLMINVVPALMTTLLTSALKGDADDPEKLAKKIAADQLGYLLGQMIYVRELSSAMSGYSGYQGPAGTRFFSEFGKLGKQLAQGEADEAALRALNQTAGILLQYPATQVEKTVRGIDALRSGKTKNPAAVLFGPPAKK